MWSFKKPDIKQIQKYIQENISYYFTYLEGIADIPWIKLHFLDECHFDLKDLRRFKVIDQSDLELR